jgi:hypothetical protein
MWQPCVGSEKTADKIMDYNLAKIRSTRWKNSCVVAADSFPRFTSPLFFYLTNFTESKELHLSIERAHHPARNERTAKVVINALARAFSRWLHEEFQFLTYITI